MATLTSEEKKVLLALADLEPATLDQIAAKTGIALASVKMILRELIDKELLEETRRQPERSLDPWD